MANTCGGCTHFEQANDVRMRQGGGGFCGLGVKDSRGMEYREMADSGCSQRQERVAAFIAEYGDYRNPDPGIIRGPDMDGVISWVNAPEQRRNRLRRVAYGIE